MNKNLQGALKRFKKNLYQQNLQDTLTMKKTFPCHQLSNQIFKILYLVFLH